MNRWDALFLVGVILLALGTAMLAIPAGVIVAGIGLIVFAVVGARSASAPSGGRR